MRKLPLLTNSSMTMFRRCPREYFLSYVLRRRAKTKSEALQFGTLMHVGLNAWWGAEGRPLTMLKAAMTMMSAHHTSIDGDPFELVKAEELMLGYTARWANWPYSTLAVERQFRVRMPLEQSDGWHDLGGAIDVIVRGHTDDTVHLVEHKTTSQDISPGSQYWQHVVALDSQVSLYMHAAKELGYNPKDTIYDVIRKPSILPLKATPEESKKYTKPTAKDPVPRLYANMRETDEEPEEYRIRLRNDIASNPERYYQRQTIVRLEADQEEHALDTVHTAEMIGFAETREAWPRSPGSCLRYGKMCDYHAVCSGSASIDDSRFVTKENTHEELGEV